MELQAALSASSSSALLKGTAVQGLSSSYLEVVGVLQDVFPANGDGERDWLGAVWNGARYLVDKAYLRS